MKTTYSDLLSFVRSFIRDHRKIQDGYYELDIDTLKDNDLEEFAATIIDYDSYQRSDHWLWLLDSNDCKALAAQFAQLTLKPSYSTDEITELKDNFLSALRTTAVKGLRCRMQDLVDEEIGDVQAADGIRISHMDREDFFGDVA